MISEKGFGPFFLQFIQQFIIINVEPVIKNMHQVQITDNNRIGTSSYILAFNRHFTFNPGQVIDIYFGKEHTRRIYSIVSGKDDEKVKILYKVYTEGLITPLLAKLKPGEYINISTPYGSFTDFPKNSVFISTGTGIAPFASFFYSGLWNGQTLIHGSRNMEEFYFSDQLNILKDKYIRCSPNVMSDNIFFGRVTGFIEKLTDIDTNIMYYLCGKAEMVTEVRDILIKKGVSFANIFAEIYF